MTHRLLCHVRKHSHSPSSVLTPHISMSKPPGHWFGLERFWLYLVLQDSHLRLDVQHPGPQQCPHPPWYADQGAQAERHGPLTASILRMRMGLTSSSSSQSASRMLWWYSSSSRLFCRSSARAGSHQRTPTSELCQGWASPGPLPCCCRHRRQMHWETGRAWAQRVATHSLQSSRASRSSWLSCSWAPSALALMPVPESCSGIMGLGNPRGELGFWGALLHGRDCTVPGANSAPC